MAESSSSPSGSNDTSATNDVNDAELEKIDFKVVWKKSTYDVSFPLDHRIDQLKEHINTLCGIPPAMMKLMYKGMLKDDSTLRDIKLTKGAKMMVMGSTIQDVLTVAPPLPETTKSSTASSGPAAEPLSQQKEHKKVIERGVPEDAMPGILGIKEGLPAQPLSGMVNKHGSKVRLTFKLEDDQVWLGTKERTEKIMMGSIKNIVSEPIKGHERYHMLAIQLGPTEMSRYWIYWVPAQYVDAIKDTILGKWTY
ncbi:ubiquitin domain-containing protein UBFD1-like isoform X2 [Dysidea avara]|uniref:ubiquitin domain-containing protein UBFD1-like isoform X2 n=1 Tax=Dysidea avara TaxID=196820 RepID=UPI00332AB988